MPLKPCAYPSRVRRFGLGLGGVSALGVPTANGREVSVVVRCGFVAAANVMLNA
jgi:hypothetical protein